MLAALAEAALSDYLLRHPNHPKLQGGQGSPSHGRPSLLRRLLRRVKVDQVHCRHDLLDFVMAKSSMQTYLRGHCGTAV